MIATTTKNGKTVRLEADYHLDIGSVYYYVVCGKVRFEFNHFGPAAKVYKTLSRRIESETFTVPCLMSLVSGARAMGYKVEEA